jgi:hypothetical protein
MLFKGPNPTGSGFATLGEGQPRIDDVVLCHPLPAPQGRNSQRPEFQSAKVILFK